MYNRYVPQPDGSYRRNRVPDQSVVKRPSPRPAPPASPPEKQPMPEYIPPEITEFKESRHRKLPPSKQEKSITGFLKQLLPRDLDTGDLLIILLLLLMAGDNSDEQNTAMLTLAFYLFM